MKLFFRSLPISISLLISLLCTATYTEAATFEVRNNCPFTVWAASVPVGGGRQLNTGRTWNIDVPAGTRDARIWGRTNCTFLVNGRGRCETGDCNGFLECIGNGAPPNTIAEYSLNQDNNLDYISISLVEGFNVAMEFSSNSNECNRSIRCTADINGECPDDLRALGGCYNPCTVFKTDEYCCNSSTCGPTEFSRFFKDKCPDAYSYPKNDPTSLFTCPEGTNYRVVFCP